MPLTIAGETYIGTLLRCRLLGTTHAIQLDNRSGGPIVKRSDEFGPGKTRDLGFSTTVGANRGAGIT
jgi:hypothetical protein